MKTSNIGSDNAYAIVRGWVGPNAAASSGLVSTTDGTTAVAPTQSLLFSPTDFTVTDLGSSGAQVSLLGSPLTSNFVLKKKGGEYGLSTVAASGAATTLDCSVASVFDITLTANCTFTITNPPTAATGGQIAVIVRQGGSGSYTVTWPAAVAWQNASTGLTGGTAPTLYTAVGAENVVVLTTFDGGTTWGGSMGGGGATAIDTNIWRPLMDGSGAVVTAGGVAVMAFGAA